MSGRPTADLLERYGGARVPRYTSYPTAPHFSPAVGPPEYRSWLRELPPTATASLYVHVPFCRRMCWYCGCHTTVTAREQPVARYVEALVAELALVRDTIGKALPLHHLHFGGGTPTLMPAPMLRRLMQRIGEAFDLQPAAEIAIEIDPRTLEPPMVAALGATGFNRASLGVQTFDPVVQTAINRVQSFDQVAAACAVLRASGIGAINFDLIYGLPHQTAASCRETVARALELEPDRLAVFGYAHVPEFKRHQRKIKDASLAGIMGRFEQSEAIADALIAAGYVQIGLDHFAKADDPLVAASRAGTLRRNFQGYTTDVADALIGIGASAVGRLPQGYVQNRVLIAAYQEAIARGELPTAKGYAFRRGDLLRGTIIERLMCDYRVDLASACSDAGCDPKLLLDNPALEQLRRDALVDIDGAVVSVRPAAHPLVRSVAAAFDAYLPNAAATHVTAV